MEIIRPSANYSTLRKNSFLKQTRMKIHHEFLPASIFVVTKLLRCCIIQQTSHKNCPHNVKREEEESAQWLYLLWSKMKFREAATRQAAGNSAHSSARTRVCARYRNAVNLDNKFLMCWRQAGYNVELNARFRITC